MPDPHPSSRFVLARASVGLAAVTLDSALALPRKVVTGVVRLPATLVGAGARGYLHVTHTVNELAVQGDAVIGALLPPTKEKPEWATFDEDAPAAEPAAEHLVEGDFDAEGDGFDAAENEADV